MVYVLDNSDSGWDMSHQSAHQYVRDLDQTTCVTGGKE